MDTNIYGSSIGLFSLYPLDVNAVFLTVNAHDFTDLLSFVMATNNLDTKGVIKVVKSLIAKAKEMRITSIQISTIFQGPEKSGVNGEGTCATDKRSLGRENLAQILSTLCATDVKPAAPRHSLPSENGLYGYHHKC